MAETSTLRRIIGTFTGMVVGAFATGVLQTLGHQLYPPPSGIDPSDTAALKAAMASAPTEALFLVLISYLIGTFCGAGVAGWSGHGDRVAVIGSTLLLLTAGLLNLMMVPHPIWFTVLCPLTFIAGGIFALRLTTNRE